MNPVYFPAIGALCVLGFDLLARPKISGEGSPRATALAGIRMGSISLISLVSVLISLRSMGRLSPGGLLSIDAFGAFSMGFVAIAAAIVLALALTHFGMARSRPAEPLALLLFSASGMLAASVTEHLLVLLVALELAWLPIMALIAIDSRRLSSSESSLKAFFAHAFASVVFAQGVVFLFGATGGLGFDALAIANSGRPLVFEIGVALILVGLIARSVIAPFHPWSPDVHEGAPSFVTAYLGTALQATSFFVLLRILHAVAAPEIVPSTSLIARIPTLFAILACTGLLWGHAMALVQVGLRRMVGWLGVGQVGFLTLALVDARGPGGEALLLALIASTVSVAGVLATLSSLSHHERACEQVGDLAGMMETSPIRATLLALFLLSLGGFPGTVGFVARFEILASIESSGHEWHRYLLLFGLISTILALAAVGRPLLAMLHPQDSHREPSRALTNEQVVLALCGFSVLYFGIAPLLGEQVLFGWVEESISKALSSLR
ncbi:MAG: proton-conducting transporter membrane subunit [Myxococcota bacterium]